MATSLEIWLPPAAQWPSGVAGPGLCLARADAADTGPADSHAAIEQGFDADGGQPLPVAALMRQHLAADAGQDRWLAADPAWIQPDMNGARLLACQQLQLSAEEAAWLGRDLQPLLAESGISLLQADPHYWQLRLPEGMSVPPLTPPSQALGADVLAFVPAGAEGRPWRILLNDIQTLLHSHPLNLQRLARGLPPVNSLWLWGAGRLPRQLHSRWQGVISDDPVVRAAAAVAGAAVAELRPSALDGLQGHWLLDLQSQQGAELAHWLAAIRRLTAVMPLRWRLSDGRYRLHRPWHRWRVWRSTWTG